MNPKRILVLAIATLFSTLMGYAMLAPRHTLESSSQPIVAEELTAPTVATAITPSVEYATEQPSLAKAPLKPVVASSPAPRVITEVQYVDAPTPAHTVYRPARGFEREHEHNESEERDGD